MYTHILLPVVFDDAQDTSASFTIAKRLANEDTQFTLLHVMEPLPTYAFEHISADVVSQSRAEIATSLTAMSAALPGSQTALTFGAAGRAIVDYAAAHEVDCIVMASHKPGFENYFIGSTADRVVRHAACAVHVIR